MHACTASIVRAYVMLGNLLASVRGWSLCLIPVVFCKSHDALSIFSSAIAFSLAASLA